MTEFEKLFLDNQDFIFKYLMKLARDISLAEELTQETFFRAYINYPSLKQKEKAPAWLCQIAKNTYYAWYNDQKRRNPAVMSEPIDIKADPEEAFVEKELSETALSCLYTLDKPYKEVFLLSVFGGLSLAEISSIFGKSESWARVTFYRAKQKLLEKNKGPQMKKAVTCFVCLLCILTSLFPIGRLLCDCFGYAFTLTNVSVFSIATALFAVGTVILDLIFKNTITKKYICAFLAASLPLSLVNVMLSVSECSGIWVAVSVWISALCCGILTFKHRKALTLCTASCVLSCLVALPIAFLSLLSLTFGSIAQNTIVKTVESPCGRYYAQVIDRDQGALGGNTFVDVHKKEKIDAIIFKIQTKPQRVYTGNWGEFENMEIYWKDDGGLVINSVAYKIE